MTPKLKRALAALPPLNQSTRFTQACPCKLCGQVSPPFDVVDFQKFCAPNGGYNFGLSGIPVAYHRCSRCGFIFTRFFDDWSGQDFARFIYNDDYIKVDGAYAGVRPAKDAEAVARLLEGLDASPRILDYGSGSGLFGRAMAALGHTGVTSYDPFTQPEKPEGLFDLITMFEVIEHAPQPQDVLADVARYAKPGAAILFSSGFQPANIATVKASWWYISPRNGHCSIFSTDSMAALAERLGFGLRGDTGLCALASWPPSAISTHVTSALHVPLFVRNLHAPDDRQALPGPISGWWGIERPPPGDFRWSAAPELDWVLQPLPTYPCRVRLVLPSMMESAPGYLAQCTLWMNGAKLSTSLVERNLVAELRLDRPGPLAVRMVGPGVSQPVPGKRSVGVAVYTS